MNRWLTKQSQWKRWNLNPDDERDPEELAQIQLLPEEQGTQDDDSHACNGRPDGIAHADIEGQRGEAEKVGGDRPTDQRGGRPAEAGETLCVSCGKGHRDFKDHGDAQI